MPAAILVLSNTPALREILIDLLTDTGYPTEAVTYTAQPLDRIQASPPRLLILDTVLPNEAISRALIREIRTMPGGGALPIILITTVQHSPPEIAAAQRQQIYILRKPFGIDPLLALVQRLWAAPPDADTSP